MSEDPPTLAQQIEAVGWASRLRLDVEATWRLPRDEWKRMEAALEAAVGTLKTLEFMREVLP